MGLIPPCAIRFAAVRLTGVVLSAGRVTTLHLAPAMAASPAADVPAGYVLPFASVQQGRELFVGKGCMVCHSVNGVGGKVAPKLDADPASFYVDPFEFMARMWRGAPNMILLQEMEIGYQIDFSRGELAHILRFLSDADEQQSFSEDDIPELVRDWMVDDVYDQLRF